MTDEPGELFRTIYSLSRFDQLHRIADETNDVLTCGPEELDHRLSVLEYTIHIVRGCIWDEDMARIKAQTPKLHHSIPPTLDDLA